MHAGDSVDAGDALIEGPLVPHDILRIKGEDALQTYLLAEVQNVYRTQNQKISDKHIEIIISQMLRKVKVENPGDTKFLPGEVVDKFRFRLGNENLAKMLRIDEPGDTGLTIGQVVTRDELKEINAKVEENKGTTAKGKRPKMATAKTLLLGITKASLQSESFVSAASFQETTKVLTEASIAGKEDTLVGLKENVILGHLIPAGTAFKPYLDMTITHNGEPVAEPEAELMTPMPDPATQPAVVAPIGGAPQRIRRSPGHLRRRSLIRGNLSQTPQGRASQDARPFLLTSLTTRVVNATLDDMRRQKPSSPIGRAELELLNYIQDHHPATVRDVADHLAHTRGIVRTTVLNMMARLVTKGYLTRKSLNGVYHYSPNIPKTQLLQNLIKDFIHSSLGGSVSPFVAYLSTDANLDDQQLAELKQLLHDLESRNGKDPR